MKAAQTSKQTFRLAFFTVVKIDRDPQIPAVAGIIFVLSEQYISEFANIAQMVEQAFRKRQVRSSILLVGSLMTQWFDSF